MTPTKQQSIALSMQKIAFLAKCIEFEQANEVLGVRFKSATINNFAKRIGSDALAIQNQMGIKQTDNFEEYSAELWRIIDAIAGLDIELVRNFANDLNCTLKELGL